MKTISILIVTTLLSIPAMAKERICGTILEVEIKGEVVKVQIAPDDSSLGYVVQTAKVNQVTTIINAASAGRSLCFNGLDSRGSLLSPALFESLSSNFVR